MSSEAVGGEGQGEGLKRSYAWRMPADWWTRKRHYFLYVVREFTSFPLAIWLLWFLLQIWASPQPKLMVLESGPAFAIFSIFCLPFALYHSWTFLSLAGKIIHLKILDKPVSSRVIVASQFAAWIGASVVIGFLLVWLAQ